MPATLQEMVAKGQAKMARKASSMVTNWGNAKTRAKSNYSLLPFPQSWKTEHAAGMDGATHRVDAQKWATNFLAKAQGQ